jgi:NAD dependent epimerase/dehydratase family enzyme
MSSIHTEDAATAVVAGLAAPGGIYNVVDDEPLTRREYVDAFAAAFGLEHLRLTPPGALRAVAGSAAKALTASQRVTNRHFKHTTGWAPAYPSAREGWAAIGAARITDEGKQR